MTTSRIGRASSSGALLAIPYSKTHGEPGKLELTTSSQNTAAYTVADPAYLSIQLKSSEWIQRYGLKSQKLTFDQILQQIGVKRVESFNGSASKTGGGLYQEVQNDNGDRYALTCRPEKLREFRNRLVRMLTLLQKRLTFLTSGSRRVFGVIGEPSVCLVCDCKTTDHRIFNQCQLAIINLFKEQIVKIKRFNIIWVANDIEVFQEKPLDVTSTTIDQAIDWISNRKYTRNKISISSTCEAILKAFTNNVHSIYLISEGTSSDLAREILRDNIVKTRLSSNTPIPIHVVSLFCQNNDTEIFLRSIAQTADGNYFSYKVKNEITNLMDPTGIKLQIGANTSIPKFEYPIDISLMYKEINQCQNIIDRLDKILGFLKDDNERPVQKIDTTKSLDAFNLSNNLNRNNNNLQRSLIIQSSALFNNDENDMASIDWLKIYGVNAQKLDFFSILHSAASQRCDGGINSSKLSENINGKDKFINMKFCDQFAHVTWTDGTIRHVYVTPELHRDYERRIRALLEKIKARLLWLKKGSRDVFGTILEKNIYILIDTSRSMENHLNFLKDKLRLLYQEQLFSKERINMVSFNTTINPWRDSLTRVNDPITQTHLQPWIDGLIAEGSTNTLAAIRFALADSTTEAIYLLTDGRPDQNERHILSQVQYRQIVPIHTIAFNCQDQTANQFLFDLAKQTGGRFHAFNYGLETSIEISESEDISHLKQEITYGEKDLQRVADLRDECIGRTWSRDNVQTQHHSPQLNVLHVSLQFPSYSTNDLTSQPSSSIMPKKINPKKRSSTCSSRQRKPKSATHGYEQRYSANINPDGWLLPETEEFSRKTDDVKKQENSSSDDDEQVATTKTTRKTNDQVKLYLKKNSLVARKLTILDVLQPTSITVKDPQHIQVIDRYVLAKVWDDLLPFTYGSYANKFRLVNHYAIDLEKYEMKLKDLIKEYYEFTSRFIWNCLDDDQKRKIIPQVYWLYLSKDERFKIAQEITREENKLQKELELFAWRKLTVDQQNSYLQRIPPYSEDTDDLLKTALTNAEAVLALRGVERMDVEIKRAKKFLQISNDLRKYQKGSDKESKHKSEPQRTPKRRLSLRVRIGQRVLCRYDGDGYFYSGSIQINEDNRIVILFDMDIEQEIVARPVLPLNLNNQSNLFIQDCVLVQLSREREEYWAPGKIVCLPSQFGSPPNLYRILIYDPSPKQICAHRKDMIRITLSIFHRSIVYLQNINRKFIGSGSIIRETPEPPPPVDFEGLESIFRKYLDPLSDEVDRLYLSHEQRFNLLQQMLEDQMKAIRLLHVKSHMKDEQAQTITTETSPPSTRTGSKSSTDDKTSHVIIKLGAIVYALWTDDDGLVYQGTVLRIIDANTFQIERNDLPGVKSNIPRSNIFLESDLCPLRRMDIASFALIKYPNDLRHCYCPSVIRRHHLSKSTTEVRFYDCYEENLRNDELVFPINDQQFELYSQIRIDKEKSLLGQAIVGLNNHTKLFMLGTIIDRVGTGHQYLIEWFDESRTQQKEEHLFGAFMRRYKHYQNAYVLAIDNNDKIYKPAQIISILNNGNTLHVEFFTKNRKTSPKRADVPATTTFVITIEYFYEIIKTIIDRHDPTSGDPKSTPGDSKPAPDDPKPTPGNSKPAPGDPKPTPGDPKPTPGDSKAQHDGHGPTTDDAKPPRGDHKPKIGDDKTSTSFNANISLLIHQTEEY